MATFRHVTVKVQKLNIFKVCVQSYLPRARYKLQGVNGINCFIDGHLVEMFPLFDQI